METTLVKNEISNTSPPLTSNKSNTTLSPISTHDATTNFCNSEAYSDGPNGLNYHANSVIKNNSYHSPVTISTQDTLLSKNNTHTHTH